MIRQKYKWNIAKVCQGMNVLCSGNKMSTLIIALYLLVAYNWINTGEWVKLVVHPMFCHSSICLFSYVPLDKYQVDLWEKNIFIYVFVINFTISIY